MALYIGSAFAILSTLSAVANAGVILEAELDGTAVNNTTATAQVIGAGAFTNDLNPNIFQGSSIGLPGISQTATVIGRVGRQNSTSDIDFFRFVLPTATTAWFDIDFGAPGQDTTLAVFDTAGTLVAWNDDLFFNNPEPGSTSALDSFIGEIGLAAGTYFATVADFANFPNARFSPGFTAQGTSFGGGTAFSSWFLEPNAPLGDSSYSQGSAPQIAATNDYQLHISYQQVPEPSTLALMAIGLAGLGFAGRRKLAA